MVNTTNYAKYIVDIGFIGSNIALIILIIFEIFKYYCTANIKKLQNLVNELTLIPEATPKYHIPYPIYYINMDKHTDRNEYFLNQLKNITYKSVSRITGINGHLINNSRADKIPYLNKKISFTNEYSLMRRGGEIGCTLSHLIAIQTSYYNGDKLAMICEDDLMLQTVKLIKPLEEYVKEAPKDWEILQLSTLKILSSPDNLNGKPYIFDEYKIHDFLANSYLINRKGMERLLRVTNPPLDYNHFNIKPVSFLNPIYGLIDFYMYRICKTYVIRPSLFIPNNINAPSTFEDYFTWIYILSSYNNLKILMDKHRCLLLKN